MLTKDDELEQKYYKEKVCPVCGSNDFKDLIGYMHGFKISEGLRCKKCGWEIIW